MDKTQNDYYDILLYFLYLMKHFFEFRLRVRPGSNGIAKKYKILNYTAWINRYHVAHTAKSAILFLIVADISQ